MTIRTQRDYRIRDQDQAKEAKRQRRDKAGQWIAGKGNDMINDEDSSSSRRGRRDRQESARSSSKSVNTLSMGSYMRLVDICPRRTYLHG